ncbi:MAG: tetratricopeptide repeat protein [Thermoguttaceae bacterium]
MRTYPVIGFVVLISSAITLLGQQANPSNTRSATPNVQATNPLRNPQQQQQQSGLITGSGTNNVPTGNVPVETTPAVVNSVESAGVPNSNSLDSIPEVREGLELLKQGERVQAAAKFAAAYQKRPDLIPAGLAVAVALANQRRFDQVRFWLEQTTEDCPNDPEAFIVLAEIAQNEHRLLEAKMLASQGLSVASKYTANPERQKNLALRGQMVFILIAERKERWTEAKERLERLIQGNPDANELLVRLGFVYFHLNDLQKSLNTFNQAKTKGVDLTSPYAIIAQLYDQKGNMQEATRYLNEAVKTGSSDPIVLAIASQMNLKWNNLADARKYAEQLLNVKPDSLDAKAVLGLIALYEKNYPLAESYYESIVKDQPEEFAGKNGLALSLCEQDGEKVKQAVEIAQELVKRHPQSMDALTTFAWVAYKVGNAEQAEQIMRQIQQNGVITAAGAYYLAEILAKKGDTATAKQLVAAALSTPLNYPKKSDAELLQKQLGQ